MDTDLYHSILTGLSQIELRPVTTESVLMCILLVIMLIFSGLISGSEAAYFSLTPNMLQNLKERNTPKCRTALRLLDNPQKLLATILIANNFINVFIVMLSAFLSSAMIDFGESTTMKFIVETIIITALILFFGEIMPKIYSTQHNQGTATFMAYPLAVLQTLFTPLSALLMRSTNVVNSQLAKHQQNMSIDELSQAVELTREGISEEKGLLEGIVKYTNLSANDIMTPRLDVVSVDISDTFTQVLQKALDSGYSRIPVYDERPDEIKGILYVKDLLPHLDRKNDFEWHTILRKAYYIPDTKMINDLLSEFQSSKTHMAIVVDEYGGMQGIVTLEDILEEIIGEISDEYDDEEKNWQRQSDGSIIFEGKISLNDFFKVIESDGEDFEKARGDAETLAGFLLEINGLIPHKQDVIRHGKYKFEILAADARKIKKVRYSIVEDKTK